MSSNNPNNVVKVSVAAGVATITLNRPDAMNAMTSALMSGVKDALDTVVADPSIRAVVLTGEGRGFCAGADLKEVAGAGDQSAAPVATEQTEQSGQSNGRVGDAYNSTMRALYDCPVPTIARVNGAAAGGGFGLALACDVVIAAESAFFVATFGPRLGIVPDMGATWSIPRRVGRARALGIALLGERISAVQAEEWGLIWQAVPDAQLDAATNDVVALLKASSPGTVTRIRETLDAAVDNSFSDQLELEMDHQAVLIARNMREGAKAFVEKREPAFSNQRD